MKDKRQVMTKSKRLVNQQSDRSVEEFINAEQIDLQALEELIDKSDKWVR